MSEEAGMLMLRRGGERSGRDLYWRSAVTEELSRKQNENCKIA